jgi:hypothetical protein
MSIERLFTAIRAAGVTLRAEAGELRYRAPKGALTDELLAQIAERRPELLAFLEATQRAADVADRLVPRRREGYAPLSFAQERLWFLDQLGLAGSAYHVPRVLRLEGPLVIYAMQQSLVELVRRHGRLLKSFRRRGGEGGRTPLRRREAGERRVPRPVR